MNRKPRPFKEGILNAPSIMYIISVGMWIGLICMLMFVYYADATINTANPRAGEFEMSIFYATLIMARIFNAFATRSISDSIVTIRLSTNKSMLFGVVIAAALSFLTINWKILSDVFATVPLSMFDWLAVTIAGATVIFYSELHKLIIRFVFKQ